MFLKLILLSLQVYYIFSSQCNVEQPISPCTSCQCTSRGTAHFEEREVFPGIWGTYQGWVTAPSPYMACGASMRIEGDLGSGGDDTAWNGLSLRYCNVNDWNDQMDQLIYEGQYGHWYDYVMCPWGQLMRGAQMRFEWDQGDGDDTGGNGLSIQCESTWTLVHAGWWGDWQHQVTNNGEWWQGVCGAEIKYEITDGGNDETTINGMKIILCHNVCVTAKCTDCIYGYILLNDNCEICSPECETCQNSTTECTLCSGGANRQNNPPACSCQEGYYPTNIDNNCPACNYKCKNCELQDTNCTECKPGTGRNLTTPTCGCSDGYYEEANNIDCQTCGVLCSTCATTKNNCLSCKPGNYRTTQAPACVCQPGYFEKNNELNCYQCNYRCKTCESTSTNCLSCDSSLNRSGPSCACNAGYYEDISDGLCKKCHSACKTCSSYDYCLSCEPGNNRSMVTPGCGCSVGAFTVDNNVTCLSCDFRCKSCETTKENCTECKEGTGRELVAPSCLCSHGFYDDNTNINCLSCQYPCYTCENSATECIQCGYGDNREDAPDCGCKVGYLEINNACEDKCSELCEECDSAKRDACTTCSENFPFFIEKNGFLQCYSECPTNFGPDFGNKNASGNIPCECSNEDGVCTTPPEPVTEQILGQGLGYMEQQDGSVAKCLQHGCRNCDGDKTKCQECMTGFYKNSENVCERCHFSCASCFGPSHSECFICSSLAWNDIGHGISYDYREGHCDRVFKQPLDYKCPDQEDEDETYDGPVCGLTDSEIVVVEREMSNEFKYSLNDASWKNIKLSGSECEDREVARNKLLIDNSFDLIQSTVETRGQELLNLAVILNLSGDVLDYKGDAYNPTSLMTFLNNNSGNLYTIYEYNPFETNDKVYCYNKLQRKSLTFDDYHIEYNDLLDLQSVHQMSDMKYTECYNTDDTFVAQAEEAFQPLKKNIFLLVNICTSQGKAVEGIFLRQDANSDYIFYNVESGQEEVFTLQAIDSSTFDSNKLMSISTVNIQKAKGDTTTIQDVINRNVYDEGVDKCDLSIIQPLIDQIMTYTKRENCDDLAYMDIRPGARGYIDNPYMQKVAFEKLQSAIDREIDEKETRIQVQSGMSTFVEEYIKYQWYLNECQCNITSASQVSDSKKAEGLEIDIGFFSSEYDGWGKNYQTSMELNDFTWGEHCSPTSYTYSEDDTADILESQITIFQTLWNCANPLDQIEVNGVFDADTESKLLGMEITGFEAKTYSGWETINCFEDEGKGITWLEENDCPNLDPPAAEYTHSNGLKYLEYARIAYCTPEDINDWNCPACADRTELSEIQSFSSKDFKSYTSFLWPKAQDNININCYIGFDETQKEIVISISGKLPKNSEDNESLVLRDYILGINKNVVDYSYCPDCKVSKEIYEGFKVVREKLFDAYHEMKESHIDATLSITGHGLGAGIATLFAMYAKEDQHVYVDQLYVFGSPRIGNKEFTQYVQDSLPEYYSVINADDGLPHLPISGGSASFRRLQNEIWYENSDSDTFKVCEIDEDSNESPDCSNKLTKYDFYLSHYKYLGKDVRDTVPFNADDMTQVHDRYDSKNLNEQE